MPSSDNINENFKAATAEVDPELQKTPQLSRALGTLRTALKENGFSVYGQNTPGVAAEKNGKYVYLKPAETQNTFYAFSSDELPEEGRLMNLEDISSVGVDVMNAMVA